jgi:hypothetical protein
MKRFFFGFAFVLLLVAQCALAQDGGSQDSSSGGELRPRRDTYIIESFPSPAMHGVTVNISYYNHNPQETALYVVDVNDKVVKELQPREMVPNGVHKFQFSTRSVSTGSYFVRLRTYTSTGAEEKVQDSRFLVTH